ncbi:MAG: hypothetical protein HC846_01915 [Blastocatellia bacterium]|nr:hypothetical protein [Blastocatellia bacterium]
MDMLKSGDLLRMKNVRGEWCVSIYLPINPQTLPDNRKRLKNLTDVAEKKLIDLGMSLKKAAKMLLPLDRILENISFRKDKNESLIMLLMPNAFIWSVLPFESDELAIVSNHFYLQPLFIFRAKELKRRAKNLLKSSNKFYPIENLPMIPPKLLTSKIKTKPQTEKN